MKEESKDQVSILPSDNCALYSFLVPSVVMMNGFVKRFDFHVKTIDGVTQQTLLGGFVTVIGAIIVVYLLLSELWIYNSTDLVTRMIADNTIGVESIRIEFDIEFPHVLCDKISFMQEVTRGDRHVHEPEFVRKDEMHDDHGASGCWVHGFTVTDKVAGNFRFAVQPEPAKDLSQDPALRNMPPGFGIGGGLHFEVFQFPVLPIMTHKINTISFRPVDMDINHLIDQKKVPEVQFPLTETHTEMDHQDGIHHYALQMVPTHYKPLGGGVLKHANQYSFVEKRIGLEQLAGQMGSSFIAGQPLYKFYGVIFTYDFYPVMVVLEEQKEGLGSFLTSLCGIIGGVITVLGLVEKCLHQSHKTIIGKKD